MLIRKNIHGQILSKEVVGNEYEYKIAHKDRIYTVYCPQEPQYDFNYKDNVYLVYKRSSILWGKKIVVLMTNNLTEIKIKSGKSSNISALLDTGILLSLLYLVSKLFSAYINHVVSDEIVSKSEVLFSTVFMLFFFWFLFRSFILFFKIGKDASLFDTLFNEECMNNEKIKVYNKYIKDNFSLTERVINKKLTEEEKIHLEKAIDTMDYSSTEKVLISDIISKPVISIRDIKNIELNKMKKEFEAKEILYKK